MMSNKTSEWETVNWIRADLSGLPADDAALFRKVLKRQTSERCSSRVAESGEAGFTVEFCPDPSLAPDSFRLDSDEHADGVRIFSAGKRGFLYGLGTILRKCRHVAEGKMFQGFPNGISTPESAFRCIYFATHFGNYYDQAPLEEIERYMEDLALWGCNAVMVWFDMHSYAGLDDPAAQRQIRRLRHILGYAEKLGLDPVLGGLSNEAFAGSPPEMRADWTSGHDGYRLNLSGHYHVELCPNRPGALELLSKWRRSLLEAFAGIGLKYIQIWHYDQGGCTCSHCAPWGVNGGIRADREYAGIARELFPESRIIFSLWRFDVFTSGEWDGIFKLLKTPQNFADILSIDLKDLEKIKAGSPGGLPVISFPEISMCGITPWGGYGANPMPEMLQAFWQNGRLSLSGFQAYSEGIYEDLNKFVCLQLGWDPFRATDEILKDYFRFSFGAEPGPEFVNAVGILEKNLFHDALVNQDGNEYSAYKLSSADPAEPWRIRHRIKADADAEEAVRIIREEEARLPDRARESWRWRLLRIRAELDCELLRHQGISTQASEEYFDELGKIYRVNLQKTTPALTPPSFFAWKKKIGNCINRDGTL